HLRNGSGRKVFPVTRNSGQIAINVIGTTKNEDAQGTNCRHWVHDSNGIIGALSATDYKQPKQIMQLGGGGHEPKIAIKENTKKGYVEATIGDGVRLDHPNGTTGRGRIQKQSSPTMTTSGNVGVVTEGLRIRKLTPKECFRLQGFPDELFHKAEQVNSDSQLYKQAGNSVTVNVIYEIAKKLKEQKHV